MPASLDPLANAIFILGLRPLHAMSLSWDSRAVGQPLRSGARRCQRSCAPSPLMLLALAIFVAGERSRSTRALLDAVDITGSDHLEDVMSHRQSQRAITRSKIHHFDGRDADDFLPSEGPWPTWPRDVGADGSTDCETLDGKPVEGVECKISTVRFRMPFDFPGREEFLAAVEALNTELKGCVHFLEYGPAAALADVRLHGGSNHFLAIDYRDTGYCGTTIGRIYNEEMRQHLIVSTRCIYRGSFYHELGHTLGLTHKQNRYDRDEWLQINWDNIVPGKAANFRKRLRTIGWVNHNNSENPVWELRQEFDVRSIMMYNLHHFSKNGLPIMEPTRKMTSHWAAQAKAAGFEVGGRDPRTGQAWAAGHRDYYAGTDLQSLRRMYECDLPPEQSYTWRTQPWDVIYKRPLSAHTYFGGYEDGWSDCAVPCGDGLQRRLLLCRGDDGKAYEDERCAGQAMPPSQRSCEPSRPCDPEKDTDNFLDPFSQSCGRYRSEAARCVRWGFLGASLYCPESCASGGDAVQPLQRASQWSKRAPLLRCTDANSSGIASWQGDICKRPCGPRGKIVACSNCMANNALYGTLGACQARCEENSACAAINVAFVDYAAEEVEDMSQAAALTHCKLYRACDTVVRSGYRFNVFWYDRSTMRRRDSAMKVADEVDDPGAGDE